jgi:hypothetical protein
MSIRGLFVVANLFALVALVACGGESPLSTGADEALSTRESSNVTSLATSAQAEQQLKVTICHVPPGNPDNAHEITVAEASLPAHFPHGDTFGTCEGEPSPPVECSGDCTELAQECCEARIDCAWTWDEFENGMCVSAE